MRPRPLYNWRAPTGDALRSIVCSTSDMLDVSALKNDSISNSRPSYLSNGAVAALDGCLSANLGKQS